MDSGRKNVDTSKPLAKTPKAWDALSRPDVLGRQKHSLLLMANGRRGVRELSLLLGEDISHLAGQMLKMGYLQRSGQAIVVDVDEELAPQD